MATVAELEERVAALEEIVESLTADVETVKAPAGFVPLELPVRMSDDG